MDKNHLLWGGVLGAGLYWFVRYLRPQHSTLVLNDKVVLVTGASSGIGRALAYAFARRGARVVLVARREDRLEAVRREIEPYTPDALVIPADLTDETQLEQVITRTLETFGRIDVLVNNAGMTHSGPLQSLDPKVIEKVLRLNLWVAIRLTQLALPHMLAQKEGYILNIGSGLSRIALPQMTSYVAAKHGLAAFGDALRRELMGTGIHLTHVLPSWTQTEMLGADSEALLRESGFQVDTPDAVAEKAVLALVQGKNEVVLGGWLPQLGTWTERHFPLLVTLFWRWRLDAQLKSGDAKTWPFRCLSRAKGPALSVCSQMPVREADQMWHTRAVRRHHPALEPYLLSYGRHR